MNVVIQDLDANPHGRSMQILCRVADEPRIATENVMTNYSWSDLRDLLKPSKSPCCPMPKTNGVLPAGGRDVM